MFLATITGTVAYGGVFGTVMQALASFVALTVAFVTAPAIAAATRGKFYLARTPRKLPDGQSMVRCCICEHPFEAEDMAQCPAYSGPICSLCCSLETRCRDACKPDARISRQVGAFVDRTLPAWAVKLLNNDVSQYVGVLSLFAIIIGSVLAFVYFQVSFESDLQRQILRSTCSTPFFILGTLDANAGALFVIASQSRPGAR